MDGKNRIVGPHESMIPGIQINGVPILIVADLPEGGFLQVVSGHNPMAQAIPGVQLADGAMLAVIPAEVAEHIRPGLRQVEKSLAKGVGPGLGPQLGVSLGGGC